MKPEPGTYALVLRCAKAAVVRAGGLGRLRLQPGFYVYLGSALGPGGVRARVAHHRKVSARPRWHIDYLRAHLKLERVWYCYDTRRREHQWAEVMKTAPGASPAMARFGASDCRCDTHLYFLERRPSRRAFQRGLQAFDRRHPAVSACARKPPARARQTPAAPLRSRSNRANPAASALGARSDAVPTVRLLQLSG